LLDCKLTKLCLSADVLAMSDVLMEDAVAERAGGVEGMDLPTHMLPLREGHPDADALLDPAVHQVGG